MANIKTIKQLIQHSSIPSSLIRAVIRQMGGWDSFKESAEDISNHGIAGGFHGFIYYAETVAFTKRNKKAIIEYAKRIADEMGETGIVSFLSYFGCLRGETQEDIADGLYNPRSENKTLIYNALAWFAAEEVARDYCDAFTMEDY